jgi:hypothetical protein
MRASVSGALPAAFVARINATANFRNQQPEITTRSPWQRRARSPPETLHASCRNRDGGIKRKRAADRCCREDGKPRHEDSLGTDPIAQRAGGQNEGGEGDGVGADDPLQLRHAAAQRGADTVECGIDDGDVELNHAVAQAHGGKRQRG